MNWRTYHAPNSGILSYAEGPRFIAIEFKDGECYLYDWTKPGRTHVAEMKKRAHLTSGLTTYINQHVRENYRTKLPRRRHRPPLATTHG